MAIFTVHVPRGADDAFARADRTRFVRDGFSMAALLFGPLYFLRHRAWIAAALWIVVVLGTAWLCRLAHMPEAAETGLALLIVLFTGLEANTIRRMSLDARGLEMADVVAARGRDDGERTFFQADALRVRPRPAPAAARSAQGMPGTGPVIGSFPGPEG